MYSIPITNKAINVLEKASTKIGIKATNLATDNYNRIWARDSAVASIAILNGNLNNLYPSILQSILLLQKAANINGQIPSNVAIDNNNEIATTSFGGPVGRTDCNFWWIIMAILYLKKTNNTSLNKSIKKQCDLIFTLAKNWEFNHKGLMYLPVSSNWADEYVTGGYVLYDQLLRYWALQLAGNYFSKKNWIVDAEFIKQKIKQHFCFEGSLQNSLFTEAQKKKIQKYNFNTHFFASFTATQIIDKYDCWSMALLLLLDIPSKSNCEKLKNKITAIFEINKNKGIPAFYPTIKKGDELYAQLQFNYSYQFKNKAGHFHNGGIWPVTNGFLIAALYHNQYNNLANKIFEALQINLINSQKKHPFAEYFEEKKHQPCGVSNLCFSAAGYLIASQASQNLFSYL